MTAVTLESILRIHLRHRSTRGTHDASRALIRKTIAALRRARRLHA